MKGKEGVKDEDRRQIIPHKISKGILSNRVHAAYFCRILRMVYHI
jgi:hypothetical protein